MKFLILAAIIGFCSATVLYPLGGRRIFFEDDSNLVIHGLTGNQFLFKQRPGHRYVEILINAVDTPMKKIYIDGETCKIVNLEGFGQFYQKNVDIEKFLKQEDFKFNYLFNVFKNYQGYVDDYQYQTLLKTLKDEYENGKICYVVYHLLTYLDQFINEDLIQHYYVKNQLGEFYQNRDVAAFVKQPFDMYQNYQRSYPYGYGSNYFFNPLYYQQRYPSNVQTYQQRYPWNVQTYQQQYPWNVQTYQQQYPSYRYQPNYFYQYPSLYNRDYYTGEKSFLKDYLVGKMYGNVMDKYYGQNIYDNHYGYGRDFRPYNYENIYGYGQRYGRYEY